MALFRLKALKSFCLDDRRYEIGDTFVVPSLVIVKDMIHRKLATPAPLPGQRCRREGRTGSALDIVFPRATLSDLQHKRRTGSARGAAASPRT